MAEDIICTVPWTCGFADGCEIGWHKANYWIYGDGTYSLDKYGDGDHDPVEESDVPNHEQETQAWKEYFQYVARTGLDPIYEFVLPTLKRREHQWQVLLRWSIICKDRGPLLIGGRRRGRGRYIEPDKLPPALLTYLLVKKIENGYHVHDDEIPDLDALQRMAEADKGSRNVHRDAYGLTFYITIEEDAKPWKEDRVRAYLRKRARQTLAQDRFNQEVSHA